MIKLLIQASSVRDTYKVSERSIRSVDSNRKYPIVDANNRKNDIEKNTFRKFIEHF